MAPLIKSINYMRRVGNQDIYLYSWDYDRSDQATFWVQLGALRYLELPLSENTFIIPQFNLTTNDNAVRTELYLVNAANFASFFNPTPANYSRTARWLTAGMMIATSVSMLIQQ